MAGRRDVLRQLRVEEAGPAGAHRLAQGARRRAALGLALAHVDEIGRQAQDLERRDQARGLAETAVLALDRVLRGGELALSRGRAAARDGVVQRDRRLESL